MSAVIESYLICDFCGATFGTENKRRISTQHRAEARQKGWVRVYIDDKRSINKRGRITKDKCPKCVSHSVPSKYASKLYLSKYYD